jgi:hypothetical protein
VAGWGERSHWHTADLVLAPTLTALDGSFIAVRYLTGALSCPPEMVVVWSLGVAFAILCKVKSADATYAPVPRFEDIVFWHTCWHGLPVLGSLVLLDMARRAPPLT